MNSNRFRDSNNTGFQFASRTYSSTARSEDFDRCCHSRNPATEGALVVYKEFNNSLHLNFSVHLISLTTEGGQGAGRSGVGAGEAAADRDARDNTPAAGADAGQRARVPRAALTAGALFLLA